MKLKFSECSGTGESVSTMLDSLVTDYVIRDQRVSYVLEEVVHHREDSVVYTVKDARDSIGVVWRAKEVEGGDEVEFTLTRKRIEGDGA